jgi:hypothetical protein
VHLIGIMYQNIITMYGPINIILVRSQICFGVISGLILGKNENTYLISDVPTGKSIILWATCCPHNRVELVYINPFKNSNFWGLCFLPIYR